MKMTTDTEQKEAKQISTMSLSFKDWSLVEWYEEKGREKKMIKWEGEEGRGSQ